jgi:hypothetical protein
MRDEWRMNWIWSPSWSHYHTKDDILNSKWDYNIQNKWNQHYFSIWEIHKHNETWGRCFSPSGVGRGHGGDIGGWWQGLDHGTTTSLGGVDGGVARSVGEYDGWRTRRRRRAGRRRTLTVGVVGGATRRRAGRRGSRWLENRPTAVVRPAFLCRLRSGEDMVWSRGWQEGWRGSGSKWFACFWGISRPPIFKEYFDLEPT